LAFSFGIALGFGIAFAFGFGIGISFGVDRALAALPPPVAPFADRVLVIVLAIDYPSRDFQCAQLCFF